MPPTKESSAFWRSSDGTAFKAAVTVLLEKCLADDGEAREPTLAERKAMIEKLKPTKCYPPFWLTSKRVDILLYAVCRNLVDPDKRERANKNARNKYHATDKHVRTERFVKKNKEKNKERKEERRRRRVKGAAVEEGDPMEASTVEKISMLWVRDFFTSPNVDLDKDDIRLACIGMKNAGSARCRQNYAVKRGWLGTGSDESNNAGRPLNIFSLSHNREGFFFSPPLTLPIPASLLLTFFFSLYRLPLVRIFHTKAMAKVSS